MLHLITALHENTGAPIRVGQKLSLRISTTSAVRQGCILAPILFCVAIDWIIRHMSFNPGITVDSSAFHLSSSCGRHCLASSSATDATTSLKSFSDSASHLGLNISWPKTKLQNIGSGYKPLFQWAGTRKVKPIWILLKQETVSASGISWPMYKSAPHSRQITMPAPHHSVFYRPVALPAAQPTASKH